MGGGDNLSPRGSLAKGYPTSVRGDRPSLIPVTKDPSILVSDLQTSLTVAEKGLSEDVVKSVFESLRTLVSGTRAWDQGWSKMVQKGLLDFFSRILRRTELLEALRSLSREDESYNKLRPVLFPKPNEVDGICLPQQTCIVWDLSMLVRLDRETLSAAVYRQLVSVLEAREESDRALTVLEWMGRNYWTLEECRKAISYLVDKRPMDLERARQIANDLGKAVVYVRPSDGSPGQYLRNSPQMESASDEQKEEIWNFLLSCVDERKWLDVQDRYVTLRRHVEEGADHIDSSVSAIEVDNAMLEICKTYRKHSAAWSIYEKMPEIDSRSLPIMSAICHQGYLAASVHAARLKDEQISSDSAVLESLAEEKKSWLTRAWTIYKRYTDSPSLHSDNNLRFLIHELLWIMSYDANETEEPLAKLDLLNAQVEKLTGSPIADEYLARPAIKLCWSSTNPLPDLGSDSSLPHKTAKLTPALDRAFDCYKRIRERVQHGKYKRIRRCDAEVYVMMLELCIRTKDVGKCAYMCQDVLDAKVEMDEDLIAAMQTVGL